jgi:hypothetical protein
LYSIEYEDGDNEDVTEDELDTIVTEKEKRKSSSRREHETPKKRMKGEYTEELYERKYRNGTEVAKVRLHRTIYFNFFYRNSNLYFFDT